jgi:hypothetical protein
LTSDAAGTDLCEIPDATSRSEIRGAFAARTIVRRLPS